MSVQAKDITEILRELRTESKRRLDEDRKNVYNEAERLERITKRIDRDLRRQAEVFSKDDSIEARREVRKIANILPEIVLPDEEQSTQEESSEEEESPENDLIVDGSTLLQDVINGHYTMEDISLAQGASIENQDPAERSALQLFDNVVQFSKKRTRDILQPSDDPRQFFQSLQQSGIDIENMRPVQLDQCVESAATAIDLMSFTRTDPNEVMDACECLMKAQLMYEAEVNLKKVADISDWKRLQIHLFRKEQEEKIKKHDEAMAELGIRPTVDETLSKDSEQFKVAAAAEAKWLKDQERCEKLHKSAYGSERKKPEEDYDIFMKYDLSLLPSDDPNVYKPLEVLCYMGLTRPKL